MIRNTEFNHIAVVAYCNTYDTLAVYDNMYLLSRYFSAVATYYTLCPRVNNSVQNNVILIIDSTVIDIGTKVLNIIILNIVQRMSRYLFHSHQFTVNLMYPNNQPSDVI